MSTMVNMAWVNINYPFEHTSSDKWKTIAMISIFLTLFLILVQPFGLVPTDRIQLLVGYLIIGSIVLIVNYFGIPYFFPTFFEDDKWSVFKAIFFLEYNFLIIAIWAHIYAAFFIRQDLIMLVSGLEIAESLIKILTVGLVAAIFLILFRYNFLARQHLELSQKLNQKLSNQLQVFLPRHDDNYINLDLEGKLVKLCRDDLLYIGAEGNYLKLYLKEDRKDYQNLYRGRMKEVEQALNKYPEFFRCHRSYIVNLKYISTTNGNSQGLNISLIDTDLEIPVARPKIKYLNSRMDMLHSQT